jgi:Tol biopolymer transport system component
MSNYICRFIALISLMTVTLSVYPIEVIEILGGKASQIPIAITTFNEEIPGANLEKMHQVIANDLERSGLFMPLNTSGVSQSQTVICTLTLVTGQPFKHSSWWLEKLPLQMAS